MKIIRRYGSMILVILALSAAIAFTYWSYVHGYIVAYADAKSHLNITRRVFDNATPGMAQLGGIWLPMLHVLMLPLVLNDFLYYSGLAGALVNGIAYIVAVSTIYALVRELTDDMTIAGGTALLLAFNINLLYMQSTPMTEVLTIMFITQALYFFFRWQKARRIHHLILLAAVLFLGTLTRYEMWALLPAAILSIIITLYNPRGSWKHQLRRVEGHLILFSSLAFLGVVMWFTWNILLFNDPFYFLKGIYSSKALQVELIKKGLHHPYHNIVSSIQYYLWACANTDGWPIICTGFLGSIVYILRKRTRQALAFVMFAAAVFGFEVYSMYTGNTTIFVPQLYPYDYFNIRYGLYALPFFAVFTSSLSLKTHKSLFVSVFIILMFFTAYEYTKMNPVTLADSGFTRARAEERVGALLHRQYTGGSIMAAAGVADPIIFLSKIHIAHYITEGNTKLWNRSLRNPSKTVNWIIINTNKENIRNEMARVLYSKHKLSAFELVYKENDWELYRKRGDAPPVKPTLAMYTVGPGDSLWHIAEKVYGDGEQWVQIARSNNLENPSLIHVDNVLRLPSKKT